MKKISLFLCFLITCFSSTVSPIRAHMLKTGGSIGAIIHIDPDDDPYVGVPANVYFEITDKESHFDPKSCNCIVSIALNEETLTSFSLFHSDETVDLSHAVAQYTFPKKGIYTIKLDGAPIQGNEFRPFSIAYEIRVAREPETSADAKPDILRSRSVVIILILFALICSMSVILLTKKKKTSL